MPSLATFEDLHRNNYTLGLYCIECDRWGSADLQRLAAGEHGSRTIVRSRFRCQDCDSIVEKQVRPPVPVIGSAVAYISAP